MALLVDEHDIRSGYWKRQRKWGVNKLKLQSHQCHEMVKKTTNAGLIIKY